MSEYGMAIQWPIYLIVKHVYTPSHVLQQPTHICISFEVISTCSMWSMWVVTNGGCINQVWL